MAALSRLTRMRKHAGGIVVAEVLPNGAADRAGCVSVGDTLISTSGWQYTRSSEYGGTTVRHFIDIVCQQRARTTQLRCSARPAHKLARFRLLVRARSVFRCNSSTSATSRAAAFLRRTRSHALQVKSGEKKVTLNARGEVRIVRCTDTTSGRV